MLAFFGLLHSWFNFFAELTCFADRLFYQDWWNTTDFGVYYRKWNGVVHDFLYCYVYLELLRQITPANASAPQRAARAQFAMLFTFVLSALVHEYIITLGLGFFYPVLLVLFLGAGVSFIWLMRILFGGVPRLANVFFWTNMMVGMGILCVLYAREYYARLPLSELQLMCGADYVYPPGVDRNSWVPLSLQPLVDRLLSDYK